eukprot:748023-Hanusia_phi.AAC.1
MMPPGGRPRAVSRLGPVEPFSGPHSGSCPEAQPDPGVTRAGPRPCRAHRGRGHGHGSTGPGVTARPPGAHRGSDAAGPGRPRIQSE